MPADNPIATPPDSFDEPWKLILERYLYDFLAFFLPDAAAMIDWSRPPEPLATELLRISPTSATGNRYVDYLVKVWLRSGDEYWVLIHIEIQSQPDPIFAERITIYFCRLLLEYNRPVALLAVLGDDNPHWRPTGYTRDLWGTSMALQFPMVKLLDYREREDELRESRNPIALLVRAHLATLETRHDAPRRKAAKLALFRDLLRAGYGRADIINLLELVDWFLRLPEPLDTELTTDLQQEFGAESMTYITSWERIGEQRGREQGLQQGLKQGLEQGLQQGLEQGLRDGLALALDLKFGAAGTALLPELARIADVAVLRAVLNAIKTAPDVAAVRAVYAASLPDAASSDEPA